MGHQDHIEHVFLDAYHGGGDDHGRLHHLDEEAGEDADTGTIGTRKTG